MISDWKRIEEVPPPDSVEFLGGWWSDAAHKVWNVETVTKWKCHTPGVANGDEWCSSEGESLPISHWMPMPYPPQEQRHE